MSEAGGKGNRNRVGKPYRKSSTIGTQIFGAYDLSFNEQIEYELPESDASRLTDDDSAIDEVYDDEDFEEIEINSGFEVDYEFLPLHEKKRASLIIFSVNDSLKAAVQNLGQSIDSKIALDGKAEKLKKIGSRIINDDFLIQMVLAGKGLPKQGYLSLEKSYAQQGKNRGKKVSDTMASKIIKNEFVEIDGQVYSLHQFFRGEGGGAVVPDEMEMLNYWSRNISTSSFTALAGGYKTVHRKHGKPDTYRKNYKRFQVYLTTLIKRMPHTWTDEEIARFYLRERELEEQSDLLKATAILVSHFRRLQDERAKR